MATKKAVPHATAVPTVKAGSKREEMLRENEERAARKAKIAAKKAAGEPAPKVSENRATLRKETEKTPDPKNAPQPVKPIKAAPEPTLEQRKAAQRPAPPVVDEDDEPNFIDKIPSLDQIEKAYLKVGMTMEVPEDLDSLVRLHIAQSLAMLAKRK